MSFPPVPWATPTLLLLSIAIAAVLVYAPYPLVAYGRFRLGFQAIATPRAFNDQLPGFSQRANWAHQNAFETFTIYTAAALMAYVVGVNSPAAGWAAIAFMVARTLYPIFYIANIPLGRSLSFGIGTASTVTLFILSLTHITR